MLNRERIMNALTFKPIDRMPLVEWPIREATMRQWKKEGFPAGVMPEQLFKLDTFHTGVPINMGIYPMFEEKVIEQNERHKIWQDNLGAIRKDFTQDDTPGFVTRSWLKFPVESREDFVEMKKRYVSSEEGRYPGNWKEQAKILKMIDAPSHLGIPFLFWTARDWMGFENLCMAFYDMPELVHEMFAFITDFAIETLQHGIADINIDMVELKEDMAYKHAPMISPKMFEEFMLPHYKRIIGFLKSNGVKFIYVDCDGNMGGLIPLWLEAGVDGVSPCEIAAEQDLLELRKKHPTLALMGGIDKRELAKGKEAIYNEVMNKIPKMLEKGGFIAHVDHAIPPDISLENYLYYRSILSEAAGLK